MTPDELLSTTRSVRQRLDLQRPVPRELLLECIDVATQAPTGSNRQGWQWLMVTDPEKKQLIGDRYREAWYAYSAMARAQYAADDPRAARAERVTQSARYLADHMADVPVQVLALIEGRPEGRPASAVAALYGSIIPAVWSFMLAARLRGLGTAYTTLHINSERAVADALGIPFERYMQVALLPVAYYTGDTFRPASRLPLESIVHWNSWGAM
jgi:nitroreductase